METDITAAAVTLLQSTLSLLSTVDLVSFWPEQAIVNDGETFDFIIVGAGTAGCIIANRLTEIEEFDVLLVEAGGDPPIESVFPAFYTLLAKSDKDWNFLSTNDGYTGQNLKDEVVAFTAGKMLGGSSSLDFMFYERPHPDDFIPWVSVSGDDSWSWDGLLRYFKKSEDMRDPDILNSIYGKNYGTNGYLKITKNADDAVKPYLESFEELGYNIVLDTNNGQNPGYLQALFTNFGTMRQSNAYAYLTPIRNRNNLHVLKNALVTKIIIEGDTATGAEIKLQNNNFITVRARKEVIVTAGTFNSAKLLMLSGVGPKKYLEPLQIKVVSDLPVGYNFQDHTLAQLVHRMDRSIVPAVPLNPFQFPVPSFTGFVSLDNSNTQPDFQTLNALVYHDTLVIVLFCSITFSSKNEICQQFFEANTGYNVLYTITELLHPESRGIVYLRSTNPEDYPIIVKGFFSDENDVENHAKYVEDFSRVINTTYFKNVGAKFVDLNLPECKGLKLGSREYWKCYVVAMSSTSYNPSSTCSLGTVVDAKLNVIGVKNLRVGDASVIPYTTSGNIKAVVNAIAEKLSDMIKIYYLKSTISFTEERDESILPSVPIVSNV